MLIASMINRSAQLQPKISDLGVVGTKNLIKCTFKTF